MINGDRVVLRAHQPSDLPVLGRMRNDPRLQRSLMALARPSSPARVEAWLSKRAADPHALFFVIADSKTDEALGFVQLVHIDPIHRTAQLGIAISAGRQRSGLANEALALLEDFAVRVHGVRKICLVALAENTAARALYGRRGYRLVGIQEEHFFSDGKHCDVVLMEKLFKASSVRPGAVPPPTPP